MIAEKIYLLVEVWHLDRYSRNIGTISTKENEMLKKSKVCVVGCGGLGGYTIEMLTRLGVGEITVVDNDIFEETNLNRQVLSDEHNIGKKKALVAKTKMGKINSSVKINPIFEFLDESNAKRILKDHQVIVDALDSIPSRLILQKVAKELDIKMVHGAIAAWYGQVSTIFPGDDTLNRIYGENGITNGIEKDLGNPSFTPALVSSIQVSEVLKILIGRGDLLRNKLMYIDLFSLDFELLEL
jgi:molybdopterin/thiamine biosynthesis adenylyltransferase